MLKLFIKDELVSQLISFAKTFGFNEIIPVVLSDAGNLIIHLTPHPVVARISTATSNENAYQAYSILNRELLVAKHLNAVGVPVLLPAGPLGCSPYDMNGTWMTFWNYETPIELPKPTPKEGAQLVRTLPNGMRQYSGELPVLGVWERTCKSARRLNKHSDLRIKNLLNVFQEADQRMRSIEMVLVPCHGDAHMRNLLSSPNGWLWMDFEDVSLMPIHWDLASFVGNSVLFGGLQEPTFRFLLEHTEVSSNVDSFIFTVSARILMSTLGNLDYALEGHGDLQFASRQLELAAGIVNQLMTLN